MTQWHSLYLRTDDGAALAERLREALTALGYAPYNPFGLMPVKPYRHSVRLFVAPSAAGWVRIVGQPDVDMLPSLSRFAPVLWLSLTGAEAGVHAYADGADCAPAAFPGIDVPAVERALQASPLHIAESRAGGLPVDALPPDVQAMAKGVDSRQAAAMFERLSGELMKRAGGDAQAARGLIDRKDAPDWGSAGAARLRLLAEAFALPDAWDKPDFTTLRDAYQAAERMRRKPGAPPFPGDEAALAAVPDALAYVPVFAGRDS